MQAVEGLGMPSALQRRRHQLSAGRRFSFATEPGIREGGSREDESSSGLPTSSSEVSRRSRFFTVAILLYSFSFVLRINLLQRSVQKTKCSHEKNVFLIRVIDECVHTLKGSLHVRSTL
jgi:hypothetical protein